MSIRRPAKIILSLAVAAVLAIPSAAGARPRTTYIVREGFWGGMHGRNVIYFYVRYHAVERVHFVLTISCHNTEFNTDSTDTFIGGESFPTTPIPRGGRITVNWRETDAARDGHITLGIHWSGRRPAADFSVDTFGDSSHPEDCHGLEALPIYHSLPGRRT